MKDIPSIKTHPVIVTLATVIICLGLLVTGLVGGWLLRVAMESRAELAVVLDDSKFMQALEVEIQEWRNEYIYWQEKFYGENTNIPDCISKPMPQYYIDEDFEFRIDEISME